MDKFADLLREAAGKIGIEAVRLWPQVVGITFVKSLFWTIATPLIVVGLLVLCRWWWRRMVAANDADPHMDQFQTFALTGSAFGLVGVTVIVGAVLLNAWPDHITGVFYPEAKTVLDLIARAK